jgi:gas vesicle protein
MIKGIVEEKLVDKEDIYPYVGVGSGGTKVLFVAPKSGYVLENFDNKVIKREIGEWSNSWEESLFTRINCTVEFS